MHQEPSGARIMAYTTIDDPSAHHQTDLYTGTGSTLSITNDGNSDLQPDLIWIKNRSDTDNHMIYDSSRGATKRVIPNDTGAEATDTNGVTSFNSDGATMGDKGAINTSSELFVAWQWKANGGSTTTNDASATGVGSIDSVYQANTTAGFSIVTWSGTGSAGTIAHGLGAVPHLMIVKNRTTAENWGIYHHKNTAAPETDYKRLNTNDATADASNVWNDTAPTSTVFSVGDGQIVGTSGDTFVGYLFTEKQGYSKFGSFTGTNSTDGPFIYLGFKPAFMMFGSSSTATSWGMFDNKRDTFNVVQAPLYSNVNNAGRDPADTPVGDFLSNGFKKRVGGSHWNASSGEYLYMAFAESPFVTSGGIPCTAR